MKFSTQILLLIGAILFLMKGGLGIVAAAWKMILPTLLIGGAWYMIRKVIAPANSIKPGAADSSQRFQETDRNKARNPNAVIEICPHCLSEVGSCPKCRKKTFF